MRVRTPSTPARSLALAMTLGVALALLVGDVALAQTSDVGRNVGREVKAWGTALLLGVAAIVAIPILAKRDINGGLVLVLLVVLVGGFVFAPGSVRDVIDGLWRAIAG